MHLYFTHDPANDVMTLVTSFICSQLHQLHPLHLCRGAAHIRAHTNTNAHTHTCTHTQIVHTDRHVRAHSYTQMHAYITDLRVHMTPLPDMCTRWPAWYGVF